MTPRIVARSDRLDTLWKNFLYWDEPQLLHRHSRKLTSRRIRVQDAPRVICDEQGVAHVVEDESQALLALPSSSLGKASLRSLPGAVDRRHQIIRRYRLDEIIVALLTQRAKSAFHRGVSGQDHDLCHR